MKDGRGLTKSAIVAVSMIAVVMSAYMKEERKSPSMIRSYPVSHKDRRGRRAKL